MRWTVLILLPVLFIIVYSLDHNYREFRVLSGLVKRQHNDHLDQCAPVEFIMKQLGVVNVLAFLDASWPFSHKQASMLKLLKDRLQRSGLPETLFFVVMSTSATIGDIDDDVETAAWEGVAPEEAAELLANSREALESLEEIITPDIFVIQDSEELGQWRKLKGSRDQILVIDRCGKLAYQVIVPWSILHFPYVKAAILSTHKDDPCGRCDAYATVLEFDAFQDHSGDRTESEKGEETTLRRDNDLEKWETDESTLSDVDTTTDGLQGHLEKVIQEETSAETHRESQNYPEENEKNYLELPGLRIIMHAPHYHVNGDSSTRHEYLVLQSNKPDYHGHLDVPENDVNMPRRKGTPAQTIIDSIVFDKDESPGLYGEVADFWRDTDIEDNSQEAEGRLEDLIASTTQPENFNDGLKLTNEDLSIPGLQDEPVTSFGEYTVEEEESRSKLIAHYSRLLPWIYYVLNK